MAKEAKETSIEPRRSVPWKPIAEMARWERDMERMLGNFFTGRLPSFFEDRFTPGSSLGMREPSLDLYEEKDQIVVKAELPGMTKDDIQVSISDNILMIRGEKKKEEEDEGKDYYLDCAPWVGDFLSRIEGVTIGSFCELNCHFVFYRG